MANTCDACGERSARLTYPAGGLWAGRWFCPECASGRKKITRLSSLVAFRFRVAEVLPPGDPMTAPAVRLMVAVDDVRRAQILMVEAMERFDDPAERHRTPGDFLYSVKLLLSHMHEAGHALRRLDGWAARGADGENRVNALLAGEDHRQGMAALRKLRRFFSAPAYWESLIPRVRNAIGFHYDERAVAAVMKENFAGDALLESTAASVGGLARMADPVMRAIMSRASGGDIMAAKTEHSQALDICGHLIAFVDHLFDALVRAHRDAIVEKDARVVDVPPLIARAAEAVDAERARLRDERRKAAAAAEIQRGAS
ncbi:MAG: hypothetical protein HY615_01765 [Candidatus Rokubacteria bacterium]|nr:hypothetical protein [Candidatus Rokubacteria bacterium]